LYCGEYGKFSARHHSKDRTVRRITGEGTFTTSLAAILTSVFTSILIANLSGHFDRHLRGPFLNFMKNVFYNRALELLLQNGFRKISYQCFSTSKKQKMFFFYCLIYFIV